MSLRIGSNISSLISQRRLSESTENLSRISERLSSGQRINRASDDAAGLAIADSLRADARVYTKGISNINDTISALQISDGALSQLSGIITRQQELASQAANGVYKFTQRQALNQEAKALTEEFNRIINSTTFNGRSLLQSGVGSLVTQAGYGTISSDFISTFERRVGTGTFSTMSTISMTLTQDMQLIDWNGDGNLDLLAILGDDLGVSLGNGNGTFRAVVTYEGMPGSNKLGRSLSLGDINGDGIQDALITATDIAGGNTSYFSIFYGNANGSFSSGVQILNGDTKTYKDSILRDINGDGKADLIAMSENTNEVIFFLNNGSGSFSAALTLTGAGSPDEIFFRDIDSDGINDLLIAGSGGTSVYKGTGALSFTLSQTLSGTGDMYSAEFVDINQDGIADLIKTGGGSGLINVFLGNANGTFRSAVTYSAPNASEGLVAGDINGDGIVDLLQQTSGSFINVLIGNGDGSFRGAISVARASPGGAGQLVLGDLNKDGAVDYVTNFPGPNQIGISLGVGQNVTNTEFLDLFSQESARDALDFTQSMLTRISNTRGSLGASLSRLDVAKGVLFSVRDTSIAAESRIRDIDVAQDSAELIRNQILQRTAAEVLKQANLIPELAIRLLRG